MKYMKQNQTPFDTSVGARHAFILLLLTNTFLTLRNTILLVINDLFSIGLWPECIIIYYSDENTSYYKRRGVKNKMTEPIFADSTRLQDSRIFMLLVITS